MPTNDHAPEVIEDDALNDVSGGRKKLERRKTSATAGMLPPTIGDLKPTPAPPIPVPYPNMPNSKD